MIKNKLSLIANCISLFIICACNNSKPNTSPIEMFDVDSLPTQYNEYETPAGWVDLETPDVSPEMIGTVIPEYTLPSYPLKIIVSLFIDEKGLLNKAEVDESTSEDYNDVFLEFVMKLKFSPALKDGQPIKSKIQVTFKFTEGSHNIKT